MEQPFDEASRALEDTITSTSAVAVNAAEDSSSNINMSAVTPAKKPQQPDEHDAKDNLGINSPTGVQDFQFEEPSIDHTVEEEMPEDERGEEEHLSDEAPEESKDAASEAALDDEATHFTEGFGEEAVLYEPEEVTPLEESDDASMLVEEEAAAAQDDDQGLRDEEDKEEESSVAAVAAVAPIGGNEEVSTLSTNEEKRDEATIATDVAVDNDEPHVDADVDSDIAPSDFAILQDQEAPLPFSLKENLDHDEEEGDGDASEAAVVEPEDEDESEITPVAAEVTDEGVETVVGVLDQSYETAASSAMQSHATSHTDADSTFDPELNSIAMEAPKKRSKDDMNKWNFLNCGILDEELPKTNREWWNFVLDKTEGALQGLAGEHWDDPWAVAGEKKSRPRSSNQSKSEDRRRSRSAAQNRKASSRKKSSSVSRSSSADPLSKRPFPRDTRTQLV